MVMMMMIATVNGGGGIRLVSSLACQSQASQPIRISSLSFGAWFGLVGGEVVFPCYGKKTGVGWRANGRTEGVVV